MKKSILSYIISLAVAAMLFATLFQPSAAANDASAMISLPFRDLTAQEITDEMGLGWNLGNTMDGHSGFMPSETAWQDTVTTIELIKSVHDAGFNTVRIPVTWGLKIDDENNYTIDEEWMNRVKEIADYCLAQDMYVIINIHHDGAEQTGWLRVASEGDELEAVKEKFAAVWQQIAVAFAGYDEHVIFESMNEVKSDDDSSEGVIRDFNVINELNQIFVDTVRSTGGNNTRRWLLVPGRYTNIVNTTNEDNGFKLPEDPWNDENRLMVSVHDYDYSFGLVTTMGITSWSEESADKMAQNFQLLVDDFTSQGIPVVLGEYGAVNKNNTEARAYYYEVIARLSRLSGVICCAWDQGWYDMDEDPDYSFSLFDRASGEVIYPEIVGAILRGYAFADTDNGLSDITNIVKGTKDSPVEITEIESISLSYESLSLTSGSWIEVTAEVLPEDTNETVLYSTSNASVATVYNGIIRAKSVGRCVIYATSESGEVQEMIEVTVYPDESLSTPLESITTDEDAYTLAVSEAISINAVIPDASDDALTFVSTDSDVATVSSLGEIMGKSEGTAYIVITSRSGLTKTVSVSVTPKATSENSLEAALYVYYNDEEHSFYNNCQGETVTIAGDGTYTLTFDCDTHLTEDAAEAGVTSLANTGAIYIADTQGTNGLLASCDIFYDEILLDGQALTVTQTEPKTALKTGDRFDTNDPINAWDGSYVAEASAQDYVISFEGNAEPKTITITFTISNFVLAKDVESEEVVTVPSEILKLTESAFFNSSDKVTLEAELTPSDTTDSVCFISSNPSVVWVSPVSVMPDSKGVVTTELIPIGIGDAVISVITESGDTKEITVSSTYENENIVGTAYIYISPSEYIKEDAEELQETAIEEVKVTATLQVTATPSPKEEIEAETESEGGMSVVWAVILGLAGGIAVLAAALLFIKFNKKS